MYQSLCVILFTELKSKLGTMYSSVLQLLVLRVNCFLCSGHRKAARSSIWQASRVTLLALTVKFQTKERLDCIKLLDYINDRMHDKISWVGCWGDQSVVTIWSHSPNSLPANLPRYPAVMISSHLAVNQYVLALSLWSMSSAPSQSKRRGGLKSSFNLVFLFGASVTAVTMHWHGDRMQRAPSC